MSSTGLEQLNATRTSVARDGSTERLLDETSPSWRTKSNKSELFTSWWRVRICCLFWLTDLYGICAVQLKKQWNATNSQVNTIPNNSVQPPTQKVGGLHTIYANVSLCHFEVYPNELIIKIAQIWESWMNTIIQSCFSGVVPVFPLCLDIPKVVPFV